MQVLTRNFVPAVLGYAKRRMTLGTLGNMESSEFLDRKV